MKTVCLFCASMDGKDSNYKIEMTNNFGDILLKHNYSLLYGGGILGLMGVAAKSAKKKGVKIISIFPEYLDEPGIIFSKSQKVIKTKNILERKKKMIELSDIFVCLPGGIGTLDEITEVLSTAALGEHSKPIFLINTNNFWSPFMSFWIIWKKINLLELMVTKQLNLQVLVIYLLLMILRNYQCTKNLFLLRLRAPSLINLY